MTRQASLKRLERLAARRSVSGYSAHEQQKLETMTDEQLAREIAIMEDVLRTLYDAGALDGVLVDEELGVIARQVIGIE